MTHKPFLLTVLIILSIAHIGIAQPTINGNHAICVGSTLTLNPTPTGGVWSSSSTDIALVGAATGIVTGISEGTATIVYSNTTSTVTPTPSVSAVVTINPLPARITGFASVCPGCTTTLNSATTGGTWSSDNTAIASVVAASGVVTGGATQGTMTIIYTLPTSCATSTQVTVHDPIITLQPVSCKLDKNGNAAFFLTANSATSLSYQWQVQVDPKIPFTIVSVGENYLSNNENVLSIIDPDKNMKAYSYRCVVTNAAGAKVISDIVKITGSEKQRGNSADDNTRFDTANANYNDSTHYRFLIGSNFDFNKGPQLQNLYSHVQFYLPGAFGSKKRGGLRFGFVAGIYENTQITQLDDNLIHYVNEQGRQFTDSIILNHPQGLSGNNADSGRYTRLSNVGYKAANTSTVTGIYLEPTVRLWHIGQGTDMYVFGHLDMLYNVTVSDTDFSYKILDSPVLQKASLNNYTQIPDSGSHVTTYNYQFYYGAGLMLHHKNKFVDTYIKMMWGLANLTLNNYSKYYGAEIGVAVLPVNVMLGVEYRGLFSQQNPTYYNIYLSKVFSLDKLASLLGK